MPSGDTRKLRELVLYLAAKCERHERFGATKLNKLLFFADFTAYVELGHSITGAAYRRMPYGPVPDECEPAAQELIRSERALLRGSPVAGRYLEKRLFALERPDLSLFTADEIALVDEIIDRFARATATELSELSHEFPGWRLAKDGEEIPYFAALIPTEPPVPTEGERAWVNRVLARWDRE